MRRRAVLLSVVTALTASFAVEWCARSMQLDIRQQQAIAIAAGAQPENSPGDTYSTLLSSEIGASLDYLPRGFRLEKHGFQGNWGWCDFAFDGPSVLVLGDSTTRQSMALEEGANAGDFARHTWPALLQQELGDGVQVCVIAEDGYHPQDLLVFVQLLEPLLKPVAVLGLLCENDLMDFTPRVALEREDGVVFYRAQPRRMVFSPLLSRSLYQWSEAYRFLQWRLALAFPRYQDHVDVHLVGAKALEQILSEMETATGRLGLFFLPTLQDERQDYLRRRLAVVERTSGVDIVPVPLHAPLSQFRKDPPDTVHVNVAGHRQVVGTVLPHLRAWLEQTDR